LFAKQWQRKMLYGELVWTGQKLRTGNVKKQLLIVIALCAQSHT